MDNVSKTLYIPLYGKSYVSSRGLFLRDESAERIWSTAGFPLKGKAKSKWLAYNMGMRAAVFDGWLAEKRQTMPEAVVLHIGCGLDGRCQRVGTGAGRWYDVDFSEVISTRKLYFEETENYRMIAADIREQSWLKELPAGSDAIVVMEGISMYLKLPELQDLLLRITEQFGKTAILMDTYTVFAAKATKYKNPINEVGVTQVYGFDDPAVLTEHTGLRFAAEHSLTLESMILRLPKGEQRFFRMMFAGKMAKKVYRLYEYEA